MKQQITRKELNELSYKAKWKLYLMHLPSWDDFCMFDFKDDNSIELPLLTIGQMIEILGINYYHAIAEYGGVNWVNPDKLCDELWEAVKKMLEHK